MRVREYATGPDVHHDVLLSNIAVTAFSTGEDGLVGDMLFPSITVGKQSDKYAIIEKGAFLRVPETLRAPKTAARRVEFDVSSDSYFAHNHALAGEISMEDIANADAPFQLRQNTTKLVTGDLRRAQEVRIANTVSSITNIGSGVALTGGDKWSDFANSDPIAAVNTGHAFIRSNTGLIANTAVIDWDTMQVVRRHPVILDLFKYTSGGELTNAQLQQVFKVDRVLIPHAIKENALEGGTSSLTNVWGNICLLAHVGAATGFQTRTLGARFQWRNPIFPANFNVSRGREDRAGQRKVEVVEAGHYQDEKIVAGDLGYAINNTL